MWLIKAPRSLSQRRFYYCSCSRCTIRSAFVFTSVCVPPTKTSLILIFLPAGPLVSVREKNCYQPGVQHVTSVSKKTGYDSRKYRFEVWGWPGNGWSSVYLSLLFIRQCKQFDSKNSFRDPVLLFLDWKRKQLAVSGTRHAVLHCWWRVERLNQKN